MCVAQSGKIYAGRYDDLHSTVQILVNAEAGIDLAVARHPGPAIASPFSVFCLYPSSFRSNVLGSISRTKTTAMGKFVRHGGNHGPTEEAEQFCCLNSTRKVARRRNSRFPPDGHP